MEAVRAEGHGCSATKYPLMMMMRKDRISICKNAFYPGP